VVAVLGGYVGVNAFTGPIMVDVPELVGLTKAAARDAADEAGLQLEIDRRRHPEVPEGSVIEQRPAVGELEEGSVVRIVVSAGPPLVAVPDVVGLEEKVARARLLARHLELGKVTERYDLEEEEGTVVAQRPSEGKLEWGQTVALVVSKGPEPLDVPDVSGLTAKRATRLLKKAGFAVVLSTAYSDDVSEGRVISTSPSGGMVASEGGTIEVVVSAGPEFKEFKMPDVRGMGIEEARGRLESLGLRVRVVQSCGGGGTIVAEQQPLPGTTVRETDRADLFTC
jgi:beta-lactam-binding protein with PASTA domain